MIQEPDASGLSRRLTVIFSIACGLVAANLFYAEALIGVGACRARADRAGLAAAFLNAATQMNQVLGQRLLYSIEPAARGRINAIYMTVVVLAGASGSAVEA